MKRLKLNGKIELYKDEQAILATVYDIFNDKLHVSIAGDDRGPKLLYPGDKVICLSFEKNYGLEFEAVVESRILGNVPIYELTHIENVKEIQRRMDVRVSCSIPILYSGDENLLKIKDEIMDQKYDYLNQFLKEGITVDMSGGGLKFSCHDRFFRYQELLLIINLAEKSIMAKAKILYISSRIIDTRIMYSYGVKFIDIEEKKRDEIVKYLFVLMRKNRLHRGN